MSLLSTIERHLRRSGTPATRFGQEAMRDPRFVFDLRKGREPGAATVARVLAHIGDTPPLPRTAPDPLRSATSTLAC